MARPTLEDFYGPQIAARYRRRRRPSVVSASRIDFADIPLTDEGKAQLTAAMNATISALRSAIASGRQAVANVGLFTSLTTDLKAHVSSGLDQMEALIQARLVGQQGAVLAGDLPIDKWQNSAVQIKDGIKSQLDTLHEDNASAILVGNFNDQMNEIAAAAKKFAQKVEGAAKTFSLISGLGLVGLAGLALWVFLPVIRGTAQAYTTAPLKLIQQGQPGQPIQGYRRRRKRRK